ncbi:MAG: hypothetical protein IT249_09775 [Chitinophagaceae bacterium]|nr:hypothetical protein [Chitinophagaceae bacterium]
MNEALLIILILITGVTFFNLTKKIGIAAPVIVPELHKNGLTNFPENIASVIYSGASNEANTAYNNIWSITATADISPSPVSNKITVIYHQCKRMQNLELYADEAIPDVCVASTISDIQYRHVLLG